jgi:hypothetical protein
MVTTLTFQEQADGKYAASFTASGTNTLVQVQRVSKGYFRVTAGCDAEHQTVIVKEESPDVVCRLCLPEGTVVRVVSDTLPSYGKVIVSEIAGGSNISIDNEGNITVD